MQSKSVYDSAFRENLVGWDIDATGSRADAVSCPEECGRADVYFVLN